MTTSPSTTVLKAFAVLELFRSNPQIGVTQCGRLLQIPRPTAHRLLTSLTEAGALARTGGGTYRLTLRLFEIGAQAPLFRAFNDQAQVALERLVAETQLPAHLGVRDGTDVVYLLSVRHDTAGRVRTRPGLRTPLYATGLGKALLAYSDDQVVRQVIDDGFERFTPYTVSSPASLRNQLDGVRRTGYAYDVEERQPGVACVARGVRDSTGAIVAAVSVTVPAEQFRGRADRLKAPLQRACTNIEAALSILPVAPHLYLARQVTETPRGRGQSNPAMAE